MNTKKKYGWESFLDAASGDIRRLDYVDRFATVPVLVKETVSSHSYWVSLYSLMINEQISIQFDYQLQHLAGCISMHALTHDIAECLTGDIVRTFKYSSTKFKEAVDSAEKDISTDLSYQIRNMICAWKEMAGEDEQYVKAVVKTADFVSLHQYMVREVERGNREIEPFYKRMQNDLGSEGEKLDKNNDKRINSMSGLFNFMLRTKISGKRTAL